MSQAVCRNCLFAILGLCVLTVPVLSVVQETHAPHWSYTGQNDPKHWSEVDPSFSACSTGHHQSPIDIKNGQKADLPILKFDYNAAPLSIIDNGHTVMVNYAAGSTLTVGDKVYELVQFHFHHPSEEHINGKKYDMVAHLVHSDANGHLAVVAVLFKRGPANPVLATLWKYVPVEKEKVASPPDVSINAKDLLPTDLGYYTFSGSLTTPPCTEGVTWYVLKASTALSPQQLASFAKLYPADNRPIQPTYQREILETR
jgi:carbonic anhydrase